MYGLNTENLMHLTESTSLDSKAGLLGLLVVVVLFYILCQGIKIIVVNVWTGKLKDAGKKLAVEYKNEQDSRLYDEDKSSDPDMQWNENLEGLIDDPDVQAARKELQELKKGL